MKSRFAKKLIAFSMCGLLISAIMAIPANYTSAEELHTQVELEEDSLEILTLLADEFTTSISDGVTYVEDGDYFEAGNEKILLVSTDVEMDENWTVEQISDELDGLGTTLSEKYITDADDREWVVKEMKGHDGVHGIYAATSYNRKIYMLSAESQGETDILDTDLLMSAIENLVLHSSIAELQTEDNAEEAVEENAEKCAKENTASTEQIQQFVIRLYKTCLNRTPDMGGLNYWTKRLESGEVSGAGAAAEFIFSAESQRNNLCYDCYIDSLYECFMGRQSDANGKAYWKQQLLDGKSRGEVFNGFASSREFSNICASYGVVRGNGNWSYAVYALTGDCAKCGAKNKTVKDFVTRMYETCLNRTPDAAGLQYWVGLIQKGTTGSEIAYNFVFSDEFKKMQLNNERYVEHMYRAFFGRECDKDGKAYWLKCLNNGTMSREEVFNGFVITPEFKRLCTVYGINVGNKRYEEPEPPAPPAEGYYTSDGYQIVDLINENIMCNLGTEPDGTPYSVYWSSAAEAVAKRRAKEISTNFCHTGEYAENIGMGYSGTCSEWFWIWYNSPGHYNTMCASGGCAYACYYYNGYYYAVYVAAF